MRRWVIPVVAIAAMAAAFAPPPIAQARGRAPQEVLQLDGDVSGVHDPSVIKEANSTYNVVVGRAREVTGP